MTLAQLWTRRLWGGVATAAAVPALLVAALALALTTGLGGLGALRQALSGPALPPAASGQTQSSARTPIGVALSALAAPAGAAGGVAKRTAVVSGAAGVVAAGSPAAPGSAQGRIGSGGGSRPRARIPAGGGGISSGGSGGRKPPPARPTPIDELVGSAAGVTSHLPGPAGPLATQTVLQAGSTLGQILPPPPPSAR